MQETFYQLGLKNNTDKIYHHRYDRFYPVFLERLRDKTFNMCEIGIYECNSISLWTEYFPSATIYAVDVVDKKECESERVKVICGDQSNLSGIDKIIDQLPMCDFIIDDGSHIPEHQYMTFKSLFDKRLNYGGTYIIEDIEGSYWKQINPEYKKYGYQFTGISIFKYIGNVYDMVNDEFSNCKNILNISSITYAHNCIVITKRTEEEIDLCSREYRWRKFQ